MTNDSPSRQQDKFVLRLPDGMRDKIAQAADGSGRSMNAEIVRRIEASFEAEGKREEMLESLRTLADATRAVGEYKARQDRLLSQTAWYLREVVDRVPQEDPTTKAVMAGIRGFANALAHGKFEEAEAPLSSLIDLGVNLGIIDPETRKPREPFAKLSDLD